MTRRQKKYILHFCPNGSNVMKFKLFILSFSLFLVFAFSACEANADPIFCGWYCPGDNYADMTTMTGCRVAEEWRCNNQPQITTTVVSGRLTSVCSLHDWSYTCPCNYLGCMSYDGFGNCTRCNSNGGEPPCSPVGRFVPNFGMVCEDACLRISGFTGGTWSSCQLINGSWKQFMTGTPSWETVPGTTCTDVVPPTQSCTKTCQWRSSVDYSGSSCVDGIQEATTYYYTEETYVTNDDPCAGKDVPTSRTCGVCESDSSTTIYKNPTEITDDSACAFSSEVSNVNYLPNDAIWTWDCDTPSAAPPANCTGLNSFIDIGLRIKDDSAPGGVIVVGVEEETNFSPLRIYKDMSPTYTKKIWSIGLVPVSHPDASKARIKVSSGERALKEATPTVIECCKLGQSVFPCKLCSCVPDCSNASNVCVGDVFDDGCGGLCTGTKIGTCSGAATVCSGTQFNDSCGDPTCTGTMPGTCSNASAYNTDCSYADSCGSKTCTGSVVKTSQWYMNDRTNMSCNALCIANGWNVCLAIGINATAPFWSANTQRYIYSSASYSPGTSVNTVITNDMKTWCNCYKNVLPCP